MPAWSLVHGIAKLAVAQRFPFRSKAEVLKFAKKAIEGSLRGASVSRKFSVRALDLLLQTRNRAIILAGFSHCCPRSDLKI